MAIGVQTVNVGIQGLLILAPVRGGEGCNPRDLLDSLSRPFFANGRVHSKGIMQQHALCVCVYIYAVKLLTGPSLGVVKVINWAKFGGFQSY